MPSISELKAKGWGDPDTPGYEADNIVAFEAAGRRWRVNAATKPLFHAMILLLEQNGANIAVGALDDWSYANRDIRGATPGNKSWHSVGNAIDVNAIHNALGSMSTTFPINRTRKAADDCSLTWGYLWGLSGGRPDPMHLEYNRSRSDVPRALRKLRRRHPLLYRKVTR